MRIIPKSKTGNVRHVDGNAELSCYYEEIVEKDTWRGSRSRRLHSEDQREMQQEDSKGKKKSAAKSKTETLTSTHDNQFHIFHLLNFRLISRRL
jgi:hypothetical protein